MSLAASAVVIHNSAMTRTYPQMKLRLPPNLKEAIERAALANGRTINAEIVWRLTESVRASGVSQASRSLVEIMVQMNSLSDRIGRLEHEDNSEVSSGARAGSRQYFGKPKKPKFSK